MLIPEWRKFPRMLSMQAMSAALALQLTWQSLDADQRASLPPGVVSGCTIGLLVLGMLGRLLKQPEVRDPDA